MTRDDRRTFQRFIKRLNVRVGRDVKNYEYKEMDITVATSENISASGMLINCKAFMDIQEIVRVTFLKPNTFDVFEGAARVIRIEQNHDMTFTVGLRFLNLTAAEMNTMDYSLSMSA